MVSLSSILVGLPTGLEVVSGEGHMNNSSSQATIYASDRAILNFKTFNVDTHEKVVFRQPSTTATALARVSDAKSEILGILNTNGNLFLVNPQGIYFGPESSINAGSFIASTLEILDEDFLSKKLTFLNHGNSQEIVNLGKMRVNDLAVLLSPKITNEGNIFATRGNIYLGSGEKAVLTFDQEGLIGFAVEGEQKEGLIENKGKIYAPQGTVELSLKVVRKTIQAVINDGDARIATEMIESNGVVQLVSKSEIKANKIHIDADGKQTISGFVVAPSVHILGDHITLYGGIVFASGSSGGEVLIGGDFGQGKVREACSFFMNDHASIYADSQGRGSGGKICIWSKGVTTFNGNLYARGGALEGDGGLVQTVGKAQLKIGKGYVSTWAPHGKNGEWIKD